MAVGEPDPATGPSLITASSLTPKLENMVRALGSMKGTVKIKDELAKLIPGFATGDGKDLPDEASVEVLEVRRPFLVMAFLRFTSKGPPQTDDSCDDSGLQRDIRAMYVSADAPDRARIRLLGESWSAHASFDAEFFDGKHAKAVVPPIVATVPVFEVYYDHEARCGHMESGKKLEIFHVGDGKRIGEPVMLDTHQSVPGHASDRRAAIAWFTKTAPGTAHLAITQVNTETIWPCTGAPQDRSPECRTQYSCSRFTRMFVVTADSATELEQHQVESLRRADPALATLPLDRSEDSESACRRLAPR